MKNRRLWLWWHSPELRVRAMALILPVVLLLAAGCDALVPSPPTPTPVPPTLTRLERIDVDAVDAWFAEGNSDKHGGLLRRGVRVTVPVRPGDRGDNSYASPECSPAYPVIGTEDGVYFLPSDELYKGLWTSLLRGLCFASEEDAVRAGYRRAPQ
jgi:hypothetical protein